MIPLPLIAIGLASLLHAYHMPDDRDNCYDKHNKPIRCLPDFVNAAYNKTVFASNTCGNSESEFCFQTNRYSDIERCVRFGAS